MNRIRFYALKVGETVWVILSQKARGVGKGSFQVFKHTVLHRNDATYDSRGFFKDFFVDLKPSDGGDYLRRVASEKVFLSERAAIRRAIQMNTRQQRILRTQVEAFMSGVNKLERRLYSMQVKSTRKKTKEARSRAKNRPRQ